MNCFLPFPLALSTRPPESPALCFIFHIFLFCHFLLYSRLLSLKRRGWVGGKLFGGWWAVGKGTEKNCYLLEKIISDKKIGITTE